MRRNHPKHRSTRRPNLDSFDRVYIDAPDKAHIRRFISMPRKTIFINISYAPDALTRPSASGSAPDIIENYSGGWSRLP